MRKSPRRTKRICRNFLGSFIILRFIPALLLLLRSAAALISLARFFAFRKSGLRAGHAIRDVEIVLCVLQLLGNQSRWRISATAVSTIRAHFGFSKFESSARSLFFVSPRVLFDNSFSWLWEGHCGTEAIVAQRMTSPRALARRPIGRNQCMTSRNAPQLHPRGRQSRTIWAL